MEVFLTLFAVFLAAATFGIGIWAAFAFWAAAALVLAMAICGGIVICMIAHVIIEFIRDASRLYVRKLRGEV